MSDLRGVAYHLHSLWINRFALVNGKQPGFHVCWSMAALPAPPSSLRPPSAFSHKYRVLGAQGAEESCLTVMLAQFIAQIDLAIQNNERD